MDNVHNKMHRGGNPGRQEVALNTMHTHGPRQRGMDQGPLLELCVQHGLCSAHGHHGSHQLVIDCAAYMEGLPRSSGNSRVLAQKIEHSSDGGVVVHERPEVRTGKVLRHGESGTHANGDNGMQTTRGTHREPGRLPRASPPPPSLCPRRREGGPGGSINQ